MSLIRKHGAVLQAWACLDLVYCIIRRHRWQHRCWRHRLFRQMSPWLAPRVICLSNHSIN